MSVKADSGPNRHHRSRPQGVKKIFVRRNGDHDKKPKMYIWRLRQIPTIEHLKREVETVLQMGTGKCTQLYDSEGRQVTENEHVKEGGVYITCGKGEQFDNNRSEMVEYNEKKKKNENEWQDSSGNDLTEQERKRIEQKDQLQLRQHRLRQLEKKRSESARIYNRKDQTNPDAHLIYVFKNGAGTETQCVSFNKRQLDKGIQYVMELCASRFKFNPKRLCAMDGKEVKSVSELICKGAYVLVPVGEAFRHTFYFLPDKAIDTSQFPNRNVPDYGRSDSRTEADRDMDKNNYRTKSDANQYSSKFKREKTGSDLQS